MSRSDTRTDDARTLNDVGARDVRTGASRTLLSGDALKHDARQFLNTAEYEFRKVVGASRSMASAQEPDQTPTRGPAHGRKSDAGIRDNNRG